MGTNIRINVYQGDRVELLPAMCMYCGRPLGEEQYQQFPAQIGGAVHTLAFPICLMDKLPEQVLSPDGRGDPVAGVNPERYRPYQTATFAFANVNPKFAQELDRLRSLRHDQYDPQMAQSNELIQAALQGRPSAEAIEADELRRQKEAEEADAEATFGLEQAAGTGDVTKAETSASSRKLILITVIASAIGLLLVACITVGIIGYSMVTERERQEEAKKKEAPPPPKELKARIKLVDKDAGAIRLLDQSSRTKTYKVTNQTEFRDRAGNLLPLGINDPLIKEEEICVILPTPDRAGLQWLKLTPPPK